MIVTAKFKVDSIESKLGWDYSNANKTTEIKSIKLSPVNEESSSEDKKFWIASTSGHIELACSNLEVAKNFRFGQIVNVDFRFE